MEYTVDVALAARVKQLALFHHEPLRDDAALDRLVEVCRQRVTAVRGDLEVFAAAEGRVVELSEHTGISPQGAEGSEVGADDELGGAIASGETVLIVDDEPDIVNLLRATLAPEGYRLLSAHDGEAALHIARRERPSLVLLDWRMPGKDGLEVCRALRDDPDPRVRELPVVLLTAQVGKDNISAGFSAGVTDYLTKPFKPAYVRSRVRGWLLRSRPAGSSGNTPNVVPP
jgi:CheY-like chemotaxis protein